MGKAEEREEKREEEKEDGEDTREMADCLELCQAKGYGCSDYRVGANQMLSCAQACYMRTTLGVEEEQCRSHCARNGGSGCSLTVAGHRFDMCWRCDDHVTQHW